MQAKVQEEIRQVRNERVDDVLRAFNEVETTYKKAKALEVEKIKKRRLDEKSAQSTAGTSDAPPSKKQAQVITGTIDASTSQKSAEVTTVTSDTSTETKSAEVTTVTSDTSTKTKEALLNSSAPAGPRRLMVLKRDGYNRIKMLKASLAAQESADVEISAGEESENDLKLKPDVKIKLWIQACQNFFLKQGIKMWEEAKIGYEKTELGVIIDQLGKKNCIPPTLVKVLREFQGRVHDQFGVSAIIREISLALRMAPDRPVTRQSNDSQVSKKNAESDLIMENLFLKKHVELLKKDLQEALKDEDD